MTQFFAQCTERKNWAILILKVVTDWTKIWPNFLGQNDTIFSLNAPSEKNWVILTLKVESLAEL